VQPNAAGQVEMQLWGHADDANAYAFRSEFKPYVPFLGSRLAFTPQ
jgi:hypothetical protein